VRKVLLAVILLVIPVPIAMLVGCSSAPAIDLPTPVSVHVTDPRGIRSVSATVVQNGASYPVWQMSQPSKAKEATLNFTAGVKTTPQLKDGPAKLIVEATSNGMMHKSARIERDVTVVTQPPSVSVDSEQHYLYIAHGRCRAASRACFRCSPLRGICRRARFRLSLPRTARATM
jgi:hypothetical protein